MSSSGVPSTTNAGNSGVPSSAWRRSGCPRARSFGSASTIPPRKKPAPHIEGLARYRNGAGSARQEYRTLRGVNFVLGIMHIPLTALAWPLPQRPSWMRTLSQSTASPQTQRAVSVPQSVGPRPSSILLPSSCPGAPSGAWLTVAMPPRTMSGNCPRRPMSWDVSRSAPSSTSCRLPRLPSVAVPHAKKAT